MLTTRKLFLAVLSLASYLACSSQGSELYTFEYTALSGPVESFSFSFTAPTFVTTVGSSPAFAPFNVTDGTNSWTMTQDLVELSGPQTTGCFQFGTPAASLSPEEFGLCSILVPFSGPEGNEAAFLFQTTALPTAPGIYTPTYFAGIFDTAAGVAGVERMDPISGGFDPSGTMALNITDVAPEPSGVGLVVVGISVLCGLLLMKKSTMTRISALDIPPS